MLARLLVRLAALSAAAAGVVAWRRRSELIEGWHGRGWLVRRTDGTVPGDRSGAPGGLAPTPRSSTGVSAAVQVAPPAWEPAALTALAAWEPRPPRTPAGRALAYLWASPVTAAGLLAGLAGGGTTQVRDGALLFTGTRGPTAALMRCRGFDAMALGHVVVARGAPPSAALLRHELVHVRQAERLGPLMAPAYLGLLAAYGYARHPMERAARAAQRAAAVME
ncbi:hypothetical protein BH20ACT8_BH20ACT8_14450 [soil metagenome]